MPASYLVDVHALRHEHPVGAIGLLPNTLALVRDGSRTRDRQICSLMLYPLSYSGRCYAEPAPFSRRLSRNTES